MNGTNSLIIFILSLSLTVMILSLRKLKSSSSSFTRAVRFKNMMKTHYNEYKSALKNENGYMGLMYMRNSVICQHTVYVSFQLMKFDRSDNFY